MLRFKVIFFVNLNINEMELKQKQELIIKQGKIK